MWRYLFVAATIVQPAWCEEFTIGERTLRVPDGYEIERIAGPPLVDRPISISRDEKGRLYATDSAGMSDKADKQLATKPHRIVRMEDTDGDGRYDKSTVFADKMMFPEGCLWFEGSLYVAAPPEIWKLTDTNDDGVADQREVWYDGKTLTGCANDLHGPYLGPDGWFYFCKGAFAEQKHMVNGKEFVTRSSHIFRCRPDGTELEPVLTGGMDNPVGVAFLSTGERILSCTFFQFPEAGRRDGLIHAIYGGVYGKKHDSIYEHKMTGDVMPVLNHQGAAAPCGIIAGSESLFGGGSLDHVFCCYFNLHKVVEHTLIPYGATFKTEDRDFVACDHPDFHPTDVYEDADGSLIVVDTGGWYKVCCPTSQIAKPDVLGAIYRVKKKGQPKVDDPLGTQIAWQTATVTELIGYLADARHFVQRRAVAELRKRDSAAELVKKLNESSVAPGVQQRAIWTSAGMEHPTARAVALAGLKQADERVRRVAIQSCGLWRDPQSLELLNVNPRGDAALARYAAEAIGRLGDASMVPAILNAVERFDQFSPGESGAPIDDAARVLEHSLIYALIEIARPQATAVGLLSPSPTVRRAALVALDQMDNGGLTPEQVIPLLDDPNAILRNTAVWIVSHHPNWGESLVAFFTKRIATSPSESEQADLAALLSRLAKSPAIQEWLVSQLREIQKPRTSPVPPSRRGGDGFDARLLALKAMTDAGLTATPPAWFEALADSMKSAQGSMLAQCVAAARQWPQPKGGHAGLKAALIDVGCREDVPTPLRLDALLAAGPLPKLDAALLPMLIASLQNEAMGERSAAATILGSAALTSDQQHSLIAAVRTVGPLELPKLLPAFERGPNESLGLELVAALRESQGLRGLRADLVKPLLDKYPARVKEAGQSLLDELNVSAAEQAANLDRLLTDVSAGDVRRGHELFLGKKAACINCHTLGYLGGKLGPDLTNIGKARTERDLLESILYPSASFVRGYEPVVIALEDGRTVSGIVTRESRDEVVVAIDHQKTQHVARKDIVEIQPAQVSLMPQGLEKLLSQQDLMDLVTFLKAGPR